ncbi:hypothetical protein J2X65_003549 [Ancylobacter sp. 3268]|uniref:hypothetical protein n=1 Tax=Ancylobacter sp. 3268 TaxID=2817752 RepID=UPI00286312B8|nr:hypothetical protein [Ancylobacter sp. 3268]MDR6954181.1 hypothetical protein [Ancylobacter sp. 3268]
MKKSERAIARDLGIHREVVRRRIKKLGLNEPSAPAGARMPRHIQDFNRARRGFYVPPDLEPRYAELLRSGLPIEEARQQLGIEKD